MNQRNEEQEDLYFCVLTYFPDLYIKMQDVNSRRRLEKVLRTCPSKEMHVNLLQQVDGEGVDLREEADQEGDREAVGKTCSVHKTKDISIKNT